MKLTFKETLSEYSNLLGKISECAKSAKEKIDELAELFEKLPINLQVEIGKKDE